MTPAEIERAFEAACRAELDALKPGNVHRFSAGHGMVVAQFEAAAAAAAPCIAAKGAGVGTRIESAVAASLAVTGLNTNLGILMLCAPLAVAAERGGTTFRETLAEVLAGLTVADADAAFRAIENAKPGGLGSAEEHDVTEPARDTLIVAMRTAAGRDLIARQYATGFADIFDIGLARLREVPDMAGAEAVHMAFMSTFPDSHIARKFGIAIAEQVRGKAEAVNAAVDWSAPDEIRRLHLAAFDTSLKTRGLNPGTSADLTVASLFTARLMV